MEAESLSKASVLELLSHAEGEVELALSLRQELAKSSVKKYTAMESVVCPDDRARGLIQFYEPIGPADLPGGSSRCRTFLRTICLI